MKIAYIYAMEIKKDYLEIDGHRLYYSELGTGLPTLVLLGWASNVDDFPYQLFNDKLQELSINRFIFIHLSNFYKSTLSAKPLNLSNYIRQLNQVLKKLNINKVNLIGHSAGGRIASCFTIDNNDKVDKLILLNSAGLRHTEASETMLSRAHNYFCKKDDEVCEEDMSILRQTFKNLYNTDLTNDLHKIKSPTLIVWGKNDDTINVSKAYIFEQEIPNAYLQVYPHLGHNTFHEPEVINQIFEFLNNNNGN